METAKAVVAQMLRNFFARTKNDSSILIRKYHLQLLDSFFFAMKRCNNNHVMQPPSKKRQLRTLTIIENKRIMNNFGGIFSLLGFKFGEKKLKPYSDLTASMIGEIMHCMR